MNFVRRQEFFIFAVLFILSLQNHAASFNCDKASTAIEKAVCENVDISFSDENLAHHYNYLLSNCPELSKAQAVKSSQLKWLKSLPQRVGMPVKPDLLRNEYNDRINYLATLKSQCPLPKVNKNANWWKIDCSKTNLVAVNTICDSKDSELKRLYNQFVQSAQQMQKECNDASHYFFPEQKASFNNVVGETCSGKAEFCLQSYINRLKEIAAMCKETPQQKRSHYVIEQASKKFNFEINLVEFSSASPGTVTVKTKSGKTIQQIMMENISVSFQNGEILINSAQLYDYQGTINVGDFNFDGLEDFAVQNGNMGSYGGPSYDVYLNAGNKFVYSNELSELILGSLGFFNFDPHKKRISTFSKSGCCYHEGTQYEFRKGHLVAVERDVDQIGDDGMGVSNHEILVNGKWKTTKSDKYRPEGYCEEKLDQAVRILGHYVGTSATRVCKLLPTNKRLGVVSLRYPSDGKNWQSYNLGVDVFLAEAETGTILAQYSNPNEFQDAHNMEQSIDTAPYQLTKNIRAFGVRSYFDNVSKGLSYQLMTLYVVNGNKLSPVLKNLVTGLRNAEQVINRTLQIAPSSSNGYADIIVNETSYHKSAVENATVANAKPQTKNYRLKYDGTQYVLPEALRLVP